jgi:hypothetical protein
MSTASESDRLRPSLAWLALGLALAWAVLVRVPLILNADVHLDSDLAVDGLTLLDATRGQWRWHYPGTPHIGTLPVLLSLPQALAFGANPITLVSGGTAAYLTLMVSTFLLARRAYGADVAAWGLVPLAFASTGTLWLSGRVTGGHILAAAWHAGAFALLAGCLARGGVKRAAALGIWCGLGFWLDSMFLTTLAGLLVSASWWCAGFRRVRCADRSEQSFGHGRPGIRSLAAFTVAFLAGSSPYWIGVRVDPRDAYPAQFQPVFRRDLLIGHTRILGLECLPRLIAGHLLPGFQSEPALEALGSPGGFPSRADASLVPVATTVVGLGLFIVALGALIRHAGTRTAEPSGALSLGLVASAGVVVGGFVVNINIFNSDNYRYLVTLLVPWSIGFGLVMRGAARRGGKGLAVAGIGALALALLMTLDTARWYARFGWVDLRGRPVRKALIDPGLAWLDAHREVTRIYGGYWDVYRLAFLTGGRVRGVPFPIYPDRFPEWSRDGHPEVVFVRQSSDLPFLDAARRAGGRTLATDRRLLIVSWPRTRN